MKISRNKGPLYTQIKNILKDRILHGIYPIGTNIPPEPHLEEEFEVSKITVRKAIEELSQEGFVEKRSGKGTRVLRNTSTSKLSKGKLFTEFLVESGHKLKKEVIEVTSLKNMEEDFLYPLFGAQCICIKRMYYLDEQPYIYFYHFMTMKMRDLVQENIKDQSLYRLIEQQGIILEKFTDNFDVSNPPLEVEQALQVNTNTSLLKRMRYSYSEENELIEYSEGYYNTNLQNYVLNYEK